MRIKVRVVPNSKKVEVIEGDPMKVKLKSKPEGGKANKELIEILAKHFNVSKSDIRIISGFTSRRKIVEIKKA